MAYRESMVGVAVRIAWRRSSKEQALPKGAVVLFAVTRCSAELACEQARNGQWCVSSMASTSRSRCALPLTLLAPTLLFTPASFHHL